MKKYRVCINLEPGLDIRLHDSYPIEAPTFEEAAVAAVEKISKDHRTGRYHMTVWEESGPKHHTGYPIFGHEIALDLRCSEGGAR